MEKPSKFRIIITCEHATNAVPPEYKPLYAGAEEILNSHRGWDPGAFSLASELAHELGTPLFSYPYTRLLIEPNRSAGHLKLFSEFSKSLSTTEKSVLMDEYYLPYRNRVENEIGKHISKGKLVLHLSVHSFTPELDGALRNFEIGILYDPKRSSEKAFSSNLKQRLCFLLPDYRVCMNRPYLGSSDGFTTALRRQFRATDYLGIELEVNQKLLSDLLNTQTRFTDIVARSVRDAMAMIP